MSRPAIRDDLAALEGYHSPQVDVDVRLNTNEAPGPPPVGFSEAVASAANNVLWHRYPDRSATALRTAIGQLHGVGPEQIFCANGSNEVLQTVLLTYAGPGRTVVTFEPTYALHGHIARLTGARTVAASRTDEFLVDPDHAVELIQSERPAVTFLCSPNNPTGMVEPTSTIEAVLEAVAGVGGLLVLDEATSALDSEAEGRILDDLDEWLSRRTVVLMAHRLSTISRSPRVIVLHDGQVAAQASPAELRADNQVFKTLFADQLEATENWAGNRVSPPG